MFKPGSADQRKKHYIVGKNFSRDLNSEKITIFPTMYENAN